MNLPLAHVVSIVSADLTLLMIPAARVMSPTLVLKDDVDVCEPLETAIDEDQQPLSSSTPPSLSTTNLVPYRRHYWQYSRLNHLERTKRVGCSRFNLHYRYVDTGDRSATGALPAYPWQIFEIDFWWLMALGDAPRMLTLNV